jgi:cyanophycinase
VIRRSPALHRFVPCSAPRPRPVRLTIALTLFATLTAACTTRVPSAVASPAASPRGTLLIVGGGAQPPALVERFVALAGGPGRARIAVVPMASEGAEEGGREKAADLRALGAEAFVVNVTREQADHDSIVRQIATATGIWFGGGDQARLTAALAGSAALRAIRARFAAGAVVGGTSAGAAVMSDSMITGDQRRYAPDTTGYFGDEFPSVARRTIVVAPGFGFLPLAIVDQHFIRRERHNRLLAAVLERPTMIGVGIDEGTALRVDPDGRWGVEGRSAVVIYDPRRASITDSDSPVLGASGMMLHLLPAGSLFDPERGTAQLPRRP